jgi:hypothetical protein
LISKLERMWKVLSWQLAGVTELNREMQVKITVVRSQICGQDLMNEKLQYYLINCEIRRIAIKYRRNCNGLRRAQILTAGISGQWGPIQFGRCVRYLTMLESADPPTKEPQLV